MATELAAAYLSLVPSLKGAQKSIESQLAGVNLEKTGANMGKSLSSGMGKTLSSGVEKHMANTISDVGKGMSSVFGKVAKIGVGAIASVGGAIVGLAAKGGISRAINIENAQFKFRALGLDVEQTMASCSKAVNGTMYGLDAAATVAASLGASGVEAGDQMTRALKAAAGTATMSGRSMEDIGLIFGKVAATGKLQGDELNQFAESGVNALAALSKHLGKSQAEVRELITKGKIDFQTFSDAMYATFGEAAAGANETFQGAMANVRAALSRVGEKFASPALDSLRRVFVAAIPAIDGASAALGPAVAQFSAFANVVSGRLVRGIEAFAEGIKPIHEFDENGTILSTTVDVLGALSSALDAVFGPGTAERIQTVVSVLGTLAVLGPGLQLVGKGMEIAGSAVDAFSGATGKIGGVVSSFGGFVGKVSGAGLSAIQTFGQSLLHGFIPPGVFDSIASLSSELGYGLRDCKTDLVNAFSGVKQSIADKFNGLGDAINSKLGGVPGKIKGALSNVTSVFGESAKNACDTFRAKLGLGKVADGETSKVSAAFGKVKGAAGTLGRGLTVAAGGVAAVSAGLLGMSMAAAAGGLDLQGMANGLLANMQQLTTGLPIMAQQVATMLPALVQQVVAAMPALTGALITALQSIVTVLPTVLPVIVTGLTDMITQLVPALVEMAPTLLAAGIQLFTALVNSLSEIVPVLIEQLPTLVEQLSSALIANMPALLEAGLALFMALVTAFIEMLPQLIENLPQLIDQVSSTLIGFLPQLGEAAGQLFKALVDAVPKILDALLTAVGELLNNLPGKVEEFIGQMKTAGENLIRGVANGISAGADWVISKITSICSDALGAVKSFFGIASPSKLMTKMGKFITQGLANGVEAAGKLVTKAATKVSVATEKAMSKTSGWAYGYHAAVDYSKGLASGTKLVSDATTSMVGNSADAAERELNQYIDRMIAAYESRVPEVKEASKVLTDAMWGTVYPTIMAEKYARPATGAVYDSMKVIEAAGYTLDSFMAKNNEYANTKAEWDRKLSTEKVTDATKESFAKFQSEYDNWMALTGRLTASYEDMGKWQSMYKMKDSLLTGLDAATTWSDTWDKLTNKAGVVYSQNFVDRVAEGGADFLVALNQIADGSAEEIQAVVDQFDALALAEKEQELAQRSLYVNSQQNLKMKKPKEWMLEFRSICLDVKEALNGNDGLMAAFKATATEVVDFAADLQGLDVSMDAFASGVADYVSKVSDGFNQLTKHGLTGLTEWSRNLKLNIAESQQYADDLEKVFANIDPSIDSEAFRKAIYEGGFEKWGMVVSDLAKASSDEVAAAIKLFNDSVAAANQNAINQFKALSPGAEMLQAAVLGMQDDSIALIEVVGQTAVDAANAAAATVPQWFETGQNLAGGIAQGVESKISAIAASAAAAVRSAIEAARAEAGIHSPSTVMDKTVGQMLGLGAARGIDRTRETVAKALCDLVDVPMRKIRNIQGAIDVEGKRTNPVGVGRAIHNEITLKVEKAEVRNVTDIDKITDSFARKVGMKLNALNMRTMRAGGMA